ncbi:MAG: T9SS type A sorting domain-containing protein [Ignavibacteria bacterium]|nr:T9SS type A sorting domain-containing protein [Ignavibacteria bacterium]MBT8381339.1 T9SS type A sorting domain-containing protein [Ignavibacteria bacterium]MBT8392212.1 T9SS type A sorting domain-containing protein [Ignavibacteria bacterium]NNJ53434.1 T9SS type A sorting domain-containing protein [Ignavibacteriaceae bacterium]NNL22487.1 T9SS type A sorting domain-containing protein [Ignavibacteriaceae bacterium]
MKIDLSTVTMVENVEYGREGYFYLFPALMVDKDHNVAITFSRSADTEYIGSYYSTRYANDPPGLRTSTSLAEGKGNYVVTYSGTINRWGDYFGIYLDPETDSDFWMISEYASFTNTWGTYVGHVRMVPFSGVYAFSNPDSINFGNIEVGTESQQTTLFLSNYGDVDLAITVLPPSFEDFYLETNISVPYSLEPYDSIELKFSFEPTQPGDALVNYPISTNDPNFEGYILAGNGYNIYPALSKVFYASSGEQNNGSILTINKSTGAGTTVGASLFNAIKSIAIDQESGIMYGLSAGTTSSELVRINSQMGDAYLLYTLNIPNLSCIAFDLTRTLHAATKNGEIYAIDIATGNTSFLNDALGSYSSIVFHPLTNELWATSRSLLPPNNDLIFKVNLSNGDTTIVGHTGLGKITNSVAFDENGNLFGVIGTSNETNDFISINTSTGEGTIIGPTGFKHILGLAVAELDASSVNNNENKTVPDEFALYQNYPNPFNPSTKIKFTIPTVGSSVMNFVLLKVYDVIGNEITTLVNEEKSPGYYEVQFDASSLPSGIYFYNLTSGSFSETKKMLLIK